MERHTRHIAENTLLGKDSTRCKFFADYIVKHHSQLKHKVINKTVCRLNIQSEKQLKQIPNVSLPIKVIPINFSKIIL